MRSYNCDYTSFWKHCVELNETEWPKEIDEHGDWLDRPIRKWVYDNCQNVFFSYYGTVYFSSTEDYIRFKLTWE